MSTLTLTCPRTRRGRPLYSVDPWRLVLAHPDGRTTPLTYGGYPLAFPRQRDGKPILAALQAVGAAWEQPVAQWPAAQQEAVATILESLAGYQAWQAVAMSGPHTPGGPAC
jgi:hypothetical protein